MAARKAILLRLDPKLHAELRRWADDELRSVNSQIEFLLRTAVRTKRGSQVDEENDDEENDGARGDGEPAA